MAIAATSRMRLIKVSSKSVDGVARAPASGLTIRRQIPSFLPLTDKILKGHFLPATPWMRAASISLAVAAVMTSACSGGDGEKASPKVVLTPTYPSETSTTAATPSSATPSTAPGPSGTGAVTTGAGGAGTPAAGGGAAVPTSSSFTDPTGDLTVSVDRPPRYADLAGATLSRSAAGFELRVRLADKAPASGTKERTMNVASFYDVSGDGTIDYEVWLNLAAHGWGGAYFDRTRPRGNRFGDQAGVTIEVVGNEVVARFPLAHLGGAERFRWSVASEWGRYEVIGTAAAARDDAPDGDAPARFPVA